MINKIIFTNNNQKNINRNNLLYFFGILYIVFLWTIVSVNTYQVDTVTGTTSNVDCPYQALPSTFNDMNFLDYNGEFHIHETYYYDFSAFQKKITFTLAQDSSFRIYVAPHVVDIDLWLYSTAAGSPSINHTSDATVGGDENLYAELKAGSYELKFLFFGQNKAKKLSCPTIDLEVAITPSTVMKQRLSDYKSICPSQQNFPDFTVDATKLPFTYDSDVNQNGIVMNVQDNWGNTEITLVKTYLIDLSDDNGIDKYKVDISLGFEFLTGGSLNILIQDASLSDPVDKLPCIGVQNCTIGVHTSKSHSNINQVLYPGKYNLFIYDQTHEKDYAILPSCNQFSLSINVDKAQQVEDFLNCEEYILPTSFNAPGYLNDGGYLYFDEDVLIDLSQTSNKINFTIDETSYFRAYVPDYRIDIDLRLSQYNSDGTETTIASSFKFGGEESITATLQGGDYSFQLFYFGKKADVFCDTYALEVAIQPVSDFQKCSSSNNNVPSLNDISDALKNNNGYQLNYNDSTGLNYSQTYYYVPDKVQKAQNITTTTFTVPEDTVFVFESIVESSFTTADIRLVIVDLAMSSDQTNILYVGSHDRNRHIISLILYPGNFSLQLQTGSQSLSTPMTSCMAFDLAIRITPQDKSRQSCDFIAKELPNNLNTPAYLGSSQHVQIAGEFYFPPSNFILYQNDQIFFKPTVDSILRAYTQYNMIDIDLTLYDANDNPIAWTSKFYEEEALVYQLKANTQYKLKLKYIHIGSVSSCIPYNFGMTISPKSDNPKDTCIGKKDVLPDASFIPDASTTAFHTLGSFFFKQNNTAASISVPFTIPASAGNSLFRAVLSSDFIWNNLAFELLSTDNESPITTGELTYNRLEILPVALVPNDYILHIYEPFSNNLDGLELRNCVDFTLEVGLQSKMSNSQNDSVVCPGSTLPNTFESIGYKSLLTSNSLYYAELVNADVTTGRDTVQFKITEKSMLRIYVPNNQDLNINVAVLNTNGGIIANSVSIGEDIIYVELTPGTYQIVFTYFGLGGQLPRPDDCPTFYTFISIARTSDILSNPLVSDGCQSTDLANFPVSFGNGTPSFDFSRSLLTTFPTKTIQLNNDKWAHLYVNLDYNDLVASLAMKLTGSYTSSNGIQIHDTYYPLYQGGEAFFNEILPPGNWSLSVYDPFIRSTPDIDIQCAPFTFSYALNYSSDNGKPSGSCEETTVLPQLFKDMTTFSAKNLLFKSNTQQIPIIVNSKTTYIRIFAKTLPGAQVLFNLYQTPAAKAAGKAPIFSTMSSTISDSNIFRLDPQTANYTLYISYTPNKALDCNYFDAEIALDHYDNIQKQLLCPAKMPNEVTQVPPESVRFANNQDYFISSDNYFFSSSRINLNSKNGVFSYRITVTVPGNYYLDAEIDFDFLSNDLNLVFGQKNADGSDRKIATGIDFIASNSDSAFDITNKITYEITKAGTYYIDITENMKYNNFSVINSCHYFGFSLSGVSLSDALPPRIASILPPNGNSLPTSKPLTLTITFSEALSTTQLGSLSLIQFLNQNDVFALQWNFASISPSSATFAAKNTQIKISFNDLKPGGNYSLIIDDSKLVSASNKMYVTSNDTHIYTMFDCDCNNNGVCDENGDCQCNSPWAGDDCTKCALGFHGVGNTCVANTDCQSNTCNGNGKCSTPTGVPECQCNTGYNSPNSTALCGDCAFGYQGYPKCTLIPDQEDTYCYAPILPRNLTHIQYLGFNGKVHLQDNYYIDMPSGGHDTFFQLKSESLLRVYTEPHHVDVDLWLYSVDENDNLIDVIDRSITFNREEVVLTVLQPGYYRLSFKYFNWNKVSVSNCETFNLELAIDDMASLFFDTNEGGLVDKCNSTNENGVKTLPQNYFIPNVINQNTPGKTEYHNLYKLDAQRTNQIVYLWNTTFTVDPSTNGQVLLADIELSYQFLLGDISMVIAGGNDTSKAPSCKGSTDVSVSGCVFGDNELNRNVIHATLNPGQYVLFIYAPEFTNITNVNCILLNMKTQFTFINDDEDYFNCLGDPIPPTLNTPEFLNNNFVHIQDLYLMDKSIASINFNVTTQALIRLHASQSNAINMVKLYNVQTGDTFDKSSDTIFMNIASGAYIIYITSNRISSSKNFCPLLNLEIAIEPSNTPLLITPTCPSNNKAIVPLFTATVPYIFENGTTSKKIYTVPSRSVQVVAMYSFNINQVCQFYTAVASEFLRGDLRVNLYKKLDDGSHMLFIKGTHDYNYNWLQENLDPAQYVLKVERPQLNVGNVPDCIPFEFEFSLLPLSNLPMCPGEPIPLDWNSVRFLGSEGRMHYQSDNLVIPHRGTYTHVEIPIAVTKKSVLRLYVNPHIVDIDIKLLDATNNNATIISGSNLINSEESFVTLLDKISDNADSSPNYYVQFQFWRWSKNIPECNTFSLEIGVSPLSEINPTSVCPDGKDLWPVLQTSYTNDKANYSNLLTGTDLYFQQSGDNPNSHSYTITTKVATNVHIQAGYDFISSDLAVKLVSQSKKKTYYGVSAPNRNILEAVNLPAGTYTLTIYEPYTSLPSILGCQSFNFEFYMEPYVNLDQEDGFYHYLPETLDTYAYLGYNQHVHLQGEYWMFDGIPQHNMVNFTITNSSLFRVQASILPDNENKLYNTTDIPTISIFDGSNNVKGTSFGALSMVLEMGQYYVVFSKSFFGASNVAVNVELAISTLEQVQKAIANIDLPSNCSVSPPVNIVPSTEDGTFYYHEQLQVPFELMTTPHYIMLAPFTVTSPTRIYVQVGYQFLLGDLNVQITNDDITLNFIGVANRNTNEINADLPVGDYKLVITSPSYYPPDISPHCTPYNLAIILRNISSDIHADCSIFNPIPWDLNSINGGSKEFGGPIDENGFVTIYSDDFIAPSTISTRNISFTIKEDTLVNIFTMDNLATTIDVDVFTQDTAIDQDLIFYSSLHSSAQRSSVYKAVYDPKKSNKFDISLDFSGVSKGSCPAFALQIITKPVSYLTKQLLCPANFNAKLPNPLPSLSSDGTFVEYVSSYISGDYMNKNMIKNHNHFQYFIDFNVTKTSRIEASFSFDSIATNFYVTLASRNPATGVRSTIGTADWTPELAYGETSMTSTISTGNLRAGSYSLVIDHPPAVNSIIDSSSLFNDLCFPFTYSLTIMDNKKLYVGSFTPSNGHNIVPTRNLTLQFTTSRNDHYKNDSTPLSCDDSEYIRNSFYLGSLTSSNAVYPDTATCLQEDGTKWQFTFFSGDGSSNRIQPDSTYIMTLDDNRIFDSDHNPALLPKQNVYNFIDTSCSNNGGFINDRCECSTGYMGIDCYYCEQSFHNINTEPGGAPICVSQKCEIDSCNCDPTNTATCIALGTCKISPVTDTAYCVCAKQYNGTTCTTCANGYINYPYCTPHLECGDCGKGTCEYTTGQCQCPSNFQGSHCQECASGYHGSDCSKNGSGAIIALEVIATLVAVSIVIGVGVWYVRTRYRSGVARYKMLPKFDIDDDERTTKFPGLYDNDDDDDLQFDGKKDNNTSINRGSGKTHVFSFSSMPVSALDSDDSEDERLAASNNAKNQNNNNKHLFDM